MKTGQWEGGLDSLILAPHHQLVASVIIEKQNVPVLPVAEAKWVFFPQGDGGEG